MGLAEDFADRGAGDVALALVYREEAAVEGDEGLEGLFGPAGNLRFVNFIEEVHFSLCWWLNAAAAR